MTEQPAAIDGENPAPAPEAAPDPAASPDPQAPDASPPAPEAGLTGKEPAPEAEPAVESKWPDDWRDKFAAGDEKLRKRLERFTTPDAVSKSWAELDRKLNSGELKPSSLPKDATEKEVAEYRKSIGVPETWEGYQETVKVAEDLGLGEGVSDQVNGFLKVAHENNIPPAIAKAAVDYWAETSAAEMQELQETAEKITQDQIVEMRAEYGKDWGATRTMVDNLISQHLGDTGPELVKLTLADGTKLGNNPHLVKLLANIARDVGGDAALASAEYDKGGASVEEEFKKAVDLEFEDKAKFHTPEHQQKLDRLSAAMAKRTAA